ncbi:MAG: prepilin-type N-terminal cleavage/methylation domain-containing protein [bacterium]|nr:prepilin-type N-terminal cleavage/methylation domain-containing protein [bacterium]
MRRRAGFTLMEVLLATFILALIVGMVYASFSGVTTTMAASRVSSEELRLRQFLARSLQDNLTTVFADKAFEMDVYRFVGLDDDDSDGAKDSLRFVATAPLIGGMSLPGDLKEVRYDLTGDEDSEMSLDMDDEEEDRGRELMATETPLLGGNVQELDEEDGGFVADPNYESPSWTVPIRSLDFEYYDGSEWVKEWDSQVVGRMPWCVHVRINLAKTEEQLEREEDEGFDPHDDPDFEMIVPLPAGLGRTQDARVLEDEALFLDSEEQEGETNSSSIRGGSTSNKAGVR